MQITFPEASRLLRIGALLALAVLSVGSWLLIMAALSAQAAPPPRPSGQEGPITTLGISHTCQIPSLAENPWNDTYDAATALVAGSEPLTQTLDSGGDSGTFDKDWFSFTMPAKKAFTVSTTIPPEASGVLTTTEIRLYTSAAAAQANNPASTTQSGVLGAVAASSPANQTFWVRVVNPYAATQTSTLTGTEFFCDVVYRIKLTQAGGLDNAGTKKTASTGPNRSLVYTLTLSNNGELLAPVVVTDVLPVGVNLVNVTVSPSSVTTQLLTSTTGLTWTGWISGYSSLQIIMKTTVAQGITQLRNTAWISAGTRFSRTSDPVAFPQQGVHLPIILKETQ